jgi:hypothetical protein
MTLRFTHLINKELKVEFHCFAVHFYSLFLRDSRKITGTSEDNNQGQRQSAITGQ